MPFIIRSCDKFKKIFEPSIIYKIICQLIIEHKKDSIINNLDSPEDEDEKYSFSIVNFDLKMKYFVYGLDKKNSNKDTMKVHLKY
jgi:hypothetical protein